MKLLVHGKLDFLVFSSYLDRLKRMNIYIHIYIYIYVCVCVYECVYMNVPVYICIYIYIYIYIYIFGGEYTVYIHAA